MPATECPTCGAKLSSVADGLCPSCVMQAGVDFLADSETWKAEPGTFSSLDEFGIESEGGTNAEHDGQAFGNYVLLEEIARGGMGVVYRAKQLSLNRIVALKTLLGGHLASASDLERFRVEAESVAQLSHPGIVPVHEAGEQDGIRYLCMDFVDGSNLAERISEGPLPANDAAIMLHQITDAMAHAHEQGIIHRDLKPANILLDEVGQARITDFGLARIVASDSDLTRTGQVLGTASYMSPEQASGEAHHVGPESDVYSCGAILYAMLTGRPPFQSANQLETIRQVAQDEPVPPTQLTRDIPRNLENICLRCLQKSPDRRYASAKELADDLNRYLEGRPVLARPVSTIERLWRWSARNPTVAKLVAALSISIIAGLVAVTVFWRQAEGVAELLASSLVAEKAAKQSEVDAKLEALAAEEAALAAKGEAERQTLNASRRLLQSNFSEIERLLETPVPERVAKMRTAIKESVELLEFTHAPESARRRVRDLAMSSLTIPLDVREAQQLKFETAEYFTAFSPDLRRFARKLDNDVVVGSTAGSEADVQLPTPAGLRPGMLVFGPRGDRLAVRYNNECVVWELASQKIALRTPMQNYSMSFHPNGEAIFVCDQPGRIRRFTFDDIDNTVDVELLPRLPLFHAKLNHNQSRVAVVIGSAVHVFSMQTGRRIGFMSVPVRVAEFNWSPDGRMLAVGSGDRNAYLFDVETRQKRHMLQGHGRDVVEIAFSPDGRFVATGSYDHTTRLWEAATGRHLVTVSGMFSGFSSDGRKLVTRLQMSAAIYDLDISNIWNVLYAPVVGRDESSPYRVSFSPKGTPLTLATTALDGVTLSNPRTGRVLRKLKLSVTRNAIFTPNGTTLITTSEDGIRRWPLSWDEHEGVSVGEPEIIHARSAHHCYGGLSDDGRILVVAVERSDGTGRELCVMHIDDDGRPVGPDAIHYLEAGPFLADVSISPDGRWAAGGAWHDTRLDVWNLRTGERLSPITKPLKDPRPQFSPDGRWLLVESRSNYRLISVGDWSEQWSIDTRSSRATLGFTRDSQRAIISHDSKTLDFVDVKTGKTAARLAPPNGFFGLSSSVSPDGDYLALTAPWNVTVWDVDETQRMMRQWGLADN